MLKRTFRPLTIFMPNRERSVSGEIESSEVGSPVETNDAGFQAPAAGKPGRKKNPNSQAARPAQASVEILSGGKDEALTQLRKVLKDLMAENQVLRSLLRSLGSFIGEGAGGILSKLGWDLNDFNDFVNKAETDTAWESYQRHKREEAVAGPSSAANSQTTTGQKRMSEDDPLGLRPKRPRGQGEAGTDGSRATDGYPLLVPLNPAPLGSNGLLTYYSRTFPNFVYAWISMPQPRTSSATQQSAEEGEIEPKKMEAYKLIHYHLDNYKRNNAYCLPSSLRPTLVQRTVPHESAIDSILHPELRDRLILLRGRFDLVDCLHDYRMAVTIHGDDVLAHSNWEIAETWLQRYKFLVDQATLNITNKWRRRGENPNCTMGNSILKLILLLCSTMSCGGTCTMESRTLEAHMLIRHHLDQYKDNHAYCLPSSLQPTLAQTTVPHESVIDTIPHPELRDRIIALRGRFDFIRCIHDYRLAVTIHGDDVVDHSNWEIAESWLRRYIYLVDQETLDITNRWRRERGESELRIRALTTQEFNNMRRAVHVVVAASSQCCASE
ncbi:hypothetical protein A0H81_03572 [Grifola frondosa]|uniref:Uncharacterized protein n=1 Tax=Grifola frondosa TaxID=5627 RepID=A0A1C7MHN0_GRIFR|nr:hypothetical protein A0H81_03572 [Grifola frondosa]